jgi:hypothetical protein
MRNIFIFSSVLILASFFILPAFSQQNPETITITTYYPAPFGVYEELRSQRVAIGDEYIDQGQHPWATTAIPVAGEISRDADLVVEGNVGIGTITPFSELNALPTGGLETNGPIKAGSFFTSSGGDFGAWGGNNTYRHWIGHCLPRQDVPAMAY